MVYSHSYEISFIKVCNSKQTMMSLNKRVEGGIGERMV